MYSENAIDENNPSFRGLTKYPRGSLRELWSISFPLMLSLMSGSLMLFLDRLLLAKYSLDALNASSNASMIAAAFQFAFISTACIAEVLVARNNGAGKLGQIARPVWQMIWFSLMTAIVFWPFAFMGSSLLFFNSPYGLTETDFFKWLMLFGPVYCVVGALSGFYVGLGKVKFVMISVVLANVVNVGLDLFLIFGWGDHISPMGAKGAAIATGISQAFQFIILFIDFIRERNRKKYGTGNFAFHWGSFIQCLKIGFPNSIAHTIELIAWGFFFRMMTNAGEEYITVVAISQSIFFLFTFITEGISKGATIIAANMIGAKEWNLVWKLFRSGIKFYFQMFLVLGLILVVNPTPLILWFLPQDSTIPLEKLVSVIGSACFWVWLFFLFDGINWLIVGLLTAAGDTKFVLKIGSSTVWIFAILPVYIFITLLHFSADVAWQITAFYGFMTCWIYLKRFQSEEWKMAAKELSA